MAGTHVRGRLCGRRNVWRNFVLCVDGEGPSGHRCGNPWGPKDECQSQSCNGCHTEVGAAVYPETVASLDTHQFQLMATLKPSFSQQEDCYEQIKALMENDEPSPWEQYMIPACQD